ncbi:hypothetical protein JOM56_012781 [Amanita muscaria]
MFTHFLCLHLVLHVPRVSSLSAGVGTLPDSHLPLLIVFRRAESTLAHLIGIAGDSFIPSELDHTDSLDAFKSFYVNKFIDYHAHKIAFCRKTVT